MRRKLVSRKAAALIEKLNNKLDRLLESHDVAAKIEQLAPSEEATIHRTTLRNQIADVEGALICLYTGFPVD